MVTQVFVRESEVVTDYCEPHSLILNLCHKKTASGVYSQEAQLRKQAFDDLGGVRGIAIEHRESVIESFDKPGLPDEEPRGALRVS